VPANRKQSAASECLRLVATAAAANPGQGSAQLSLALPLIATAPSHLTNPTPPPQPPTAPVCADGQGGGFDARYVCRQCAAGTAGSGLSVETPCTPCGAGAVAPAGSARCTNCTGGSVPNAARDACGEAGPRSCGGRVSRGLVLNSEACGGPFPTAQDSHRADCPSTSIFAPPQSALPVRAAAQTTPVGPAPRAPSATARSSPASRARPARV
jgi:hypothetical protein